MMTGTKRIGPRKRTRIPSHINIFADDETCLVYIYFVMIYLPKDISSLIKLMFF